MRKPLCVFARSCYDTKILPYIHYLSHPSLLVVEREFYSLHEPYRMVL